MSNAQSFLKLGTSINWPTSLVIDSQLECEKLKSFNSPTLDLEK